MRIHVLFILACFVLAFASAAHAYDPEFAKIVSYSKLMSLPPETRAEYIRQVRMMVSELEENQKTLASDSQSVADSTERNLLLDMMIHDAEAMGAGAGAAAYTAQTRRLQSQNPPPTSPKTLEARRRAWSAGLAETYRCPNLRFSDPNVPRRLRENGAQIRCLPYVFQGCQPGFRQLGKAGYKRVCYKDGLSDQQVARNRALAAQKTQRETDSKKLAATKSNQQRRVASIVDRPRVATRKSTTNERPSRRAPRKNQPMPSSPSTPEELTAAIGDSDAVRDADDEGTEAEADSHSIFDRLPSYRVSQEAEYKLNGRFDYQSADDSKCADQLSMEIGDDSATCNASSIKTAREAYFRTKAPHCLFGGNLRHYRNNQKRPGLCQHPREFCISNVACRKPDDSLVNPTEQIQVKCSKASDVLCNPMLFNLDENGKALCIPPTADATMKCNERADQVEKFFKDNGREAENIPFVTRVKAQVAGTTSAISFQGVQDAWNNFADEMNSICSDSPSKDLYCRECQVMKRRAAELNLISFNGGKPDSKGNCYEFNHMERFPAKTPGSSTTNANSNSTR